ncbi:hypothetical protein NXY07_04660 [Phocaeicola dorei]|nr:hypothetical protein [Phocaeicola dorei]
MRVIYYQNRQVSVPETLEELTPAQYYRYLEIATMANQHILLQARDTFENSVSFSGTPS